jgi:hypothetical protein
MPSRQSRHFLYVSPRSKAESTEREWLDWLDGFRRTRPMKTGEHPWPTVVCECAPADLRDVLFDLACITYKFSGQTETACGFRLEAVPWLFVQRSHAGQSKRRCGRLVINNLRILFRKSSRAGWLAPRQIHDRAPEKPVTHTES